ncbi:MAG: hypothetical protein WCQ53_04355 [bacterium]
MSDLNKYLLYSTLLSIFTEAFFVTYGVDLKLFYIVLIVNFTIILAFYEVKISTNHVLVLFFLFLNGLWGMTKGSTSFYSFIAQFIGICIVSLYYYSFFRVQKVKVEKIFQIYLRISFYLSIYGVFNFIYGKYILNNYLYRLQSIMLEPAHFVTIIMPAFYYYLASSIEKRKLSSLLHLLVLTSAIVLGNSSLGYIGVLCSLVLLIKKINIKNLVMVAALSIMVFVGFYKLSPEFQMRLDDSLSVVKKIEFKGHNLSTFALFSNIYIAEINLSNNPVFGGGLGSHVIAYYENIKTLPGVKSSLDYVNHIGLNAKDANSLLIRIISELGLLWIILIIYFIYKCSVKYSLISRAIITYFVMKLLREGHYFPPEMYFFVFLYYFNYLQNKKKEEALTEL